MLILKIIFLQAFWFGAILYGKLEPLPLFWASALCISLLNYWYLPQRPSIKRYLFLLVFFSAWGFAQDSILIKSGIVNLESFPLWLNSLWVIFLCYYGDIFNKFSNLSKYLLSLVGGIGGAFAYYSGAKLGAVNIAQGNEVYYLISVFISWALFFPLSIYLFYNDRFWNFLLDKSIYYSFDQTGFQRHHKSFLENIEEYQIPSGKVAIVTGGTSGIGGEVANFLNNKNVKTHVTGRNLEKGKQAEEKGMIFHQLDMGDWNLIPSFVEGLPIVEFLVLNAGGMPEKYTVNKSGVEAQVASQLIGHYKLLEELLAQDKLAEDARVVWVSSGGMYLKKLDLENLFQTKNYDKVATYANVKRAQITLVEDLVKMEPWKSLNIKMVTMHPGWVGTVGVKDALPGFYKWTKDRLRNTWAGADTICWLLVTQDNLVNGGFYFDREKVSPYISKSFVPGQKARNDLLTSVKTAI